LYGCREIAFTLATQRNVVLEPISITAARCVAWRAIVSDS